MKKCFFVFLFSLLYPALNAQSMFNNSYRDGRLYEVTDLVLGSNHEFNLLWRGYDDDDDPAVFVNALFSIKNSIITMKYDDGSSTTFQRGKMVKKAVYDFETETDIYFELYECTSMNHGDVGDVIYMRATFEKFDGEDFLCVHQYLFNDELNKLVYLCTDELEEK